MARSIKRTLEPVYHTGSHAVSVWEDGTGASPIMLSINDVEGTPHRSALTVDECEELESWLRDARRSAENRNLT